MFQRFTERARRSVVFAQDEARAFGHREIGTEHLLLGLLGVEEGLAARVLVSLGVTIDEVRRQVARIDGQGEGAPAGQIPFTGPAKKVLEGALRESLAIGHNYIGTEHLLLSLARENHGVAARILLDLGADSGRLRDEVMNRLRRPTGVQRGKSAEQAVSHPRWEYLVERPDPPGAPTAGWLDARGAHGWELVGFASDARVVFKRRPPAAPAEPDA